MSSTDTAPDDTGADPDLDAAILAHDARRMAYVYRRLAIRRMMVVTAFLVFVFGGCELIVAGLSSDAVAHRIAELGMIIATFMMSLSGIIAWYWGCGAYEQAGMFGRMMGGGYGMGGGFGGGMYGGGLGMGGGPGSTPLGAAAMLHPRLTKTPRPAGA